MPAAADHSPAPTPSRAVAGFAGSLLALAALVLYAAWAVLPEEVLRRHLGLTFLPQR